MPQTLDAAFTSPDDAEQPPALPQYPSLESIMGLPTALKPLQVLKREMALPCMQVLTTALGLHAGAQKGDGPGSHAGQQ